jgi:hypothetical protein
MLIAIGILWILALSFIGFVFGYLKGFKVGTRHGRITRKYTNRANQHLTSGTVKSRATRELKALGYDVTLTQIP